MSRVQSLLLIIIVSSTYEVCSMACPFLSFTYPDKSCSSTCASPLQSSGLVFVIYCTSPCMSNNAAPVINSDGSCSADCSASDGLIKIFTGGIPRCIVNCPYPKFLHQDGTCQDSCIAPLVIELSGSIQKCNYPCDGDQYLYPDKSCLNDCPSFFRSSTANGINFCNSPCYSTSSPDTFWDGSCNTTCTSPLLPDTIGGIKICQYPCAENQFLYANGDCSETCPAPLNNATIIGQNLCNSPCPSDQWIFADQTCDTSCSSPMLSNTLHNVNLCNSPCSETEYVFPYGTCSGTCDSFLVNNRRHGTMFCTTPCPSLTSGFAYWDGSCDSTCSSPLASTSRQGIIICLYSCESTQYLYQNQDCANDCISPLNNVVANARNFCKSPCSTSQSLLSDHSCNASCSLPMKKTTVHGYNICSSPCSKSSDYYYPDTNQCEAACNSPNIFNQTKYYKVCYTQLSQSSKLIETIIAIGDAAGTVGNLGLAAASLASPGDSSSSSIGTLAKMLFYIRYLNINYPEDLRVLFEATKPSSISLTLGLQMNQRTRQDLYYVPVSDKFTIYNVNSSFLVNFWDGMVLLVIIFGMVIVLLVFEFAAKILNKKWLPYALINKVRIAIQNFALLQFYICCSDIVLFGSLQISRIEIRSPLDLISIILACVGSALIIGVLCLHIFIVYKHQKISQKYKNTGDDVELKRFEKHYQGLSAFFEDFRAVSYLHESCLIFTVLRAIVFNLIISFLYNYPLFQAIIIVMLNIILVVYLGFKRPFKHIVNFLQQMIAEVILLVVNTSMLTLAFMDGGSITDPSKRDVLGCIIVFCSLIFRFMPSIFTTIKMVILAKEIYEDRKKKCQAVHPQSGNLIPTLGQTVFTNNTSVAIHLNSTVIQKNSQSEIGSISMTQQYQSTGHGISFVSDPSKRATKGIFKEDIHREQDQCGLPESMYNRGSTNGYQDKRRNINDLRRHTEAIKKPVAFLTPEELLEIKVPKDSMFTASVKRLKANRKKFMNEHSSLNGGSNSETTSYDGATSDTNNLNRRIVGSVDPLERKEGLERIVDVEGTGDVDSFEQQAAQQNKKFRQRYRASLYPR